MEINECGFCGNRLSGGVITDAGIPNAYLLGISNDASYGLVISRVTFPLFMSGNANNISFEPITTLNYCPFCGVELGGVAHGSD